MEMPDFAPPDWKSPDLRRRNGKDPIRAAGKSVFEWKMPDLRRRNGKAPICAAGMEKTRFAPPEKAFSQQNQPQL
jgi:hypothetical protein